VNIRPVCTIFRHLNILKRHYTSINTSRCLYIWKETIALQSSQYKPFQGRKNWMLKYLLPVIRKSIHFCEVSRLRPLVFLIRVVLLCLYNNTMFLPSSIHPSLSGTTYRLTPDCHVGSPFTMKTLIRRWLWSTEVNLEIIKKAIPTSQGTQSISITKINRIMPLRNIIPVCCKNQN
jgi:hypothetical protein